MARRDVVAQSVFPGIFSLPIVTAHFPVIYIQPFGREKFNVYFVGEEEEVPINALEKGFWTGEMCWN